MKTQLAKLFESDRLDEFLTALETLNSVLDGLGGNPAPRRRRRSIVETIPKNAKRRPAARFGRARITRSVALIEPAKKEKTNGKAKRAAKKTAG